jgi:4-alpha-glucanotransferase
VSGRWEAGPGAALFAALHRALGPLPLVAEDLGLITPDVLALRDQFGLPGMAVLQFGFEPGSSHAPFRHCRNLVVYTGTHDNDTTRGWFEGLDRRTRRRVLDLLGATRETVVTAMIRTAYAAVADTAVVPLQDVLGLSSEARMNTPSGTSDNWSWRVMVEQLSDETAAPLAHLAALTEREPVRGLAPSHRGAAFPDGYPAAPRRDPPLPTV